MGSDVQTEVALMRRLQRIAALPAEGLSMGYEVEACDLLIVQDTPALRASGQRLRQAKPARPVWLMALGGRLSDPTQGPAPLSEDAIRQALQALYAPHAAEAMPAASLRTRPPFADQLRALLAAHEGQAVLSLDGVDVLRLDFAQSTAQPLHSARAAADNLPGLLGPGFERLVLRVGDTAAPGGDAPRLPLTPLLWQTALRMRMVPTPIAPLTEATALRMTQWPDFRVLAHRHDDFRLCTLLLKQACTATAAAALLEIDAGAACAFFNAAYLSGYATVEAIETPLPAPAEARPRSRLARLWRGMRGGGRRRGDD
ncbi:hypothetical protein SAMN05428989_3930 [Pseudoxanthomonas sp. GM95]|uniref:hypothetical protein n=1 Tax=Pseudoxanthomonas sp. GM95 TaxID=1881043 RepID=UPI0008CD71B5|nr:hypothetical protein [Pseudoxanthomonas sp. GM95]SEM46740.1 hypothetical protein SAMN05428989_3930 [Pseudoxanthomonas sp. GM95]